jgi:hypothetical protein
VRTAGQHVQCPALFAAARWWHCQHDTASERTPFSRMLPRVIGSIGSLKRLVLSAA